MKTKTISEWLETLPDGIRERAIRNTEDRNRNVLGQCADSLSDALANAFVWYYTDEGVGFWAQVHAKTQYRRDDWPPIPDPKPDPILERLNRIEAKINKLTELPTADREPEELPESPTSLHQSIVLPLYHDRNKYADWGWVRDQTGAIVYIAQTPCGADADAHRRNKTDPAQTRVDALLQAFEIVQRLAEWSAKYPRQQVHSFSAKVDEQLIEIENAAKAWLNRQNTSLTGSGAKD